ncbi:ribonuclease R [Ancylobacter dichloromethanicus]|uniref:Ribonuclease R n=2 Tax=Ancylobacter dichloromethanicus TaxID=518825 RepID=A0A9W6J9B3_9HYPH|nr:ribonuclease R [Ancylobacter dichloromethanicus]GLK71774.1 ribonuclease R [Ancylobacter dichloromethanicus]
MAFIAAHGGDVGKREISRAFGLDGGDRIALKALLRELADEGLLGTKRRKLHLPGALPAVVLSEIVERDEDGELIATPVDWDTEENGEPPRILVRLARRGRLAGPAPTVGDRVLLKTEEIPEADGHIRHNGTVLKLIEKARGLTLGIFRRDAQGGGRLIPIDKRNMGRELAIPADFAGDAQEGDLVSVEVVRHHAYGLPTAKVRERLGSVSTEKAISLIAIHAHGIPSVFRREALAEAEAAKAATLAGREDWRELPLVTIDPPDAKDHDDAVHAAPDLDPDNEGGFILTVAIADVAAYIRPGSALDREALARGNSVYFPDRVVPMLPERISNDLCSLRPLEDRPALAVRMAIGANGRKKRHSFHRVMMRSAAKLAYAQAQAAIDGRVDDLTDPLLEGVLRPLWAAYGALKKAREARAPLDLDLPERKILLKPDGTVDKVVVPERLDAHRLIEEFMILANVAAAETLEEKHVPLVYRVHDQPSLEKMSGLREFLQTLDIKLPKSESVRPAQFNDILARVAGSELAPLVNQVILRSQAQAEYANENYGHFGLHLRRYAHFTSPIRRYADLIVHRALVRALGLGRDGLPETVTPEQLAEIAARISASERRAMAAERETIDRLIAHHMAVQIGATFRGRISGVTKAGLFVALDDTGADGFIPAVTLGQDYYRYDEGRHALIGERTGEMHRLGDRVEVKLVEAAPVAGALRFELISEGKHVTVDKRRPGGGRGRYGRPVERPHGPRRIGKRK